MVLRDGKHLNMEVENLVVGDVVNVKCGDRIPADIRIINSAGFKVCNLQETAKYLQINPAKFKKRAI